MKVNLLPWREIHRQQHKQRFVGLVVAAVAFAVVSNALFAHYIKRQQQRQFARNDYFQQKIQRLDQALISFPELEQQHVAIQSRLNVIADIQKSRNRVTQLLNQLPNVVPLGAYLDVLRLSKQRVKLTGYGDSNSHLALLLANAEQSGWFANIDIHSVVTDNAASAEKKSQFNASFDLVNPLSEGNQ